MTEISLRAALQSDAAVIRRMVFSERLNPVSLDWRRFTLAVDETGAVIGCIQVKPHRDGTREMASLVVRRESRGLGVARRLIEAVLQVETGPLYLTCSSRLQPLYNRFGFQTIAAQDLPPYYLRLHRLVSLLKQIFRFRESLAVMRREEAVLPMV